MRVEPKALVRRLTPTATRLLEAAVSRASASRVSEILPEHLLLALLADGACEAGPLLQQVGVDPGRLAARVERVLQGLRAGSAARPVFSESLFQWMEDAWVAASVERGAARLRTGELAAQFARRHSRYTAEHFPDFEEVTQEALKGALMMLAGLPEAAEAEPVAAGAGAGGSGGGAAAQDGSALKRFCQPFTQKAREGKIDPVFGRDREIRQMIDILSRRRKNNPLLVGEPGVGKTALVEGLALAIAQGDVPESLKDVEVLGLDLGALQAGASVKGEFENRLKGVIEEVKASPKPVALFIDEAHTLVGAGGPAGGADAANLLKPALARGELRTIAATTWAEYKKYFEKDAALERRFQAVKVDEPSEADAVLMIRGLAPTYEKAHGVVVRDEAVVAAVQLSHRYITGRQLPDKAVDLLDTAAARVKIELAARPEELVALEAELAGLERERTARARDAAHGASSEQAAEAAEAARALEARAAALQDQVAGLRARWEAERAAVGELKAAREALAAKRDDAAAREALGRAEEKVKAARGGHEPLVHLEVDADVVARVVSSWTGVPVGKMQGEVQAAALKLEEKLAQRVRGQDAALRTVAETMRVAHAGIRNPDAPVGVLLFVGPSGVGKTETALALADALYGGERFATVINMSEFQEKHAVSRLIGSPPGYVGYGEGGRLTEAVRQRPYSVVLLDECEKADLEVMNLFYQVFDKGVLTDGEGREVDFRNTVVILTSNLATDLVMQAFENGATPSAEDVAKLIRPALSKHFKPALLARMTIVPYAPVQGEALREIVRLKLGALASRLEASHGTKTTFAPELVDALARRCTESEAGARNVDHVLRGSLMPALARDLLERMADGSRAPRTLEVALAEDGGWRFAFGEA